MYIATLIACRTYQRGRYCLFLLAGSFRNLKFENKRE